MNQKIKHVFSTPKFLFLCTAAAAATAIHSLFKTRKL